MRKQGSRSYSRLAILVSAISLCCGLGLTIKSIAAPASLKPEIIRLQNQSESNPEQAILQFQALEQQLPAEDIHNHNELLIALIPLYIDAGNKDQAKAAIASLSERGKLTHDATVQAMASVFQATQLLDEGQLSEALNIVEQVLSAAKTVNDKRLNYQANSIAGELYSKVGNFQNALSHQLAALDALGTDEDRQSELNRAKSLDSISKLYLRLQNPETALEYNAKATSIAEKIGADALMATIANNLGYALADQKKWTQSIAAYKRGLAIARRVGKVRDQIIALNNMADAAMNQNQFAECAAYTSEAIDIAQKNKKDELVAIALANQGICHLRMGLTVQGDKEIKQGLDFLRQNKELSLLELMLGDLSVAYKKMGLYKEAFTAKDEEHELATEIFHTERDRAVMELQVRFNLTQRQKEFDALEQKNRLQNSEIQNKNLQRIVAILAILVAIAVAATTFILYRKVRVSNQRLRKSNRQLEHKSTHDQLTGLLNRRAFEELMKNLSVYSQQTSDTQPVLPSFLALLDIDHFKHINDNYGHSVGDLVLIELGKRLQSILREKDMLIRWGGEEFMIYLHGIPTERITFAIKRALNIIGETPFVHEGQTMKVTISIGFIRMPLPGENDSELSWERALHLCDDALYMAKNAGRNQAIGITLNQGSVLKTQAMEQIDLQTIIAQELVTLQTIEGPVQ